jgi:iron complex transport system ATP-binding protein
MIQIKNISFSYAGNEVLKDISFTVQAGECVGILGNNGAGKSTLVTCLNKIRKPKTGEMYINNKDVLKMSRLETARCISYVAQKNELSHMTVFDCVVLGRKPYIKWSLSREDINLCDSMIDQVGLAPFKLRNIHELSGGELQKVMLARAFVQQPQLLLLDEPTSSLDPKNQYEMLALVRQMARERNISALIVIHDLNLALRYCDKFVFIKDGLVYRYGDASIISGKTIFDVYGINAVVTEVNGKQTAVIG